MIVTCNCGKEFLTEADIYVVIPLTGELNCGCYLDDRGREMLMELKGD